MIPKKLKKGDEVRIIAPVRSLAIISKETIELAKKRLEDLGLKVTFSKSVNEKDEFNSSSIASRIEDLHEAFKDKNVKLILTVIGGFNSNQLLRYIDYNIIKNNPKILCGFSDTTSLQNAILKKAGLVTYYGPHFSTFGMKKGIDYTLDYFKKSMFSNKRYDILSSEEWSDDEWYKDQENRVFIKNDGGWILNEGKAEGKIVGGNLCTLNLLQGTEYMPSLKNSILIIEDDNESEPHHFDRDLQSLIHQKDFKNIRGILIGRFQKESKMTRELLNKIIKTKKELDNIPIVANLDFGHTTPFATMPIGGKAELTAKNNQFQLKLLKH